MIGLGRITDIYARIADLELRMTALENMYPGKVETPVPVKTPVVSEEEDELDELEG